MANIIDITKDHSDHLKIYTSISERQLLHYYEPDEGIFIAESPYVIELALKTGYEPISMLAENDHISTKLESIISKCGDIPIYSADFDILTEVTGFKLLRGALCAMKRKKLPSVEDICNNKHRIAILEDIVNPTNIGAIIRSAAALNIDAVVLTKACSDPLYRRALRVSMGTALQINWTYFDGDWHKNGINQLHEMGYKTAAMALSDDSVSINNTKLMSEEKLAIILGTEGTGLSSATIEKSDYTVKIPMYNGVDSLNVAAASAITFWQLAAQR